MLGSRATAGAPTSGRTRGGAHEATMIAPTIESAARARNAFEDIGQRRSWRSSEGSATGLPLSSREISVVCADASRLPVTAFEMR